MAMFSKFFQVHFTVAQPMLQSIGRKQRMVPINSRGKALISLGVYSMRPTATSIGFTQNSCYAQVASFSTLPKDTFGNATSSNDRYTTNFAVSSHVHPINSHVAALVAALLLAAYTRLRGASDASAACASSTRSFEHAPVSMRKGLEEIAQYLGSQQYSIEPEELNSLCHAHWTHHEGLEPRMVVFPETVEQISEVLKICNKHEISVVPYGCATGLEGHTVLCKEGIVMNLTRMNKIKALRVNDSDVTVECGIQWNALNDQIQDSGLFFPVDPGPGATIGGMISTRCSGTNAVRYGVMKDWILSLKVVLADGTIVDTGTRARKDSAGYDLVRLFCGAEGTLGIIAQATLKLANKPQFESVAVATFQSSKDVCDCVTDIVRHGIQIGCAELMDEKSIETVNLQMQEPLTVAPTLMTKFTGTQPQIEEAIKVTKQIVTAHSGKNFKSVATKSAVEELWSVRKGLLSSLVSSAEAHMQSITTDVCVPVSKLAEIVDATQKDFEESQIYAAIFGHVGDGNFHLGILYDATKPGELQKVEALYDRMVERSLACGGTCTGEHGIGMGKKQYLAQMYNPETLLIMKKIKVLFDPKNILNPGKVLDV